MSARFLAATRDTFRSLRFRNFRLFFGGQLLSQIGTWMTQVTLTLWVLDMTDSGIAVGVLMACQYLPMLLLGIWAGVVADRSDKRRLLLVVQTCAMLQSLTLATLAFLGGSPLALLYGVALAGGIATAFDNPARRVFVVELVPEDHLQNAVSINSALMTGSRVIGPALAGVVITTGGYGWAFLVDGVSYLFVLSGLWRIRPGELRRSQPAPREKGQVLSGVRYVRQQPELWIPLVMLVIVGTVAFNFNVVIPLLTRDTFHGSATTFTVMFSVLSIGSVSGALFTARRRAVTLHHIVVGSVAIGVSMLAMALSPTIVVACVAAMAMGFSGMLFLTPSTSIMQLRSEASMRGRVLALQSMVLLGSAPIGGPLVGTLSELVSPRAALAAGAVAALVAAAWGHAASNRVEVRAAVQAAAVRAA